MIMLINHIIFQGIKRLDSVLFLELAKGMMIHMLKKMALKLLLKKWDKGNFSVIFWDGEKENFGQGNPTFTLKFNQEPSWQLNNDDIVLTLGEAYMDGIIDIEGSMDQVLQVITENSQPEL